MTFEGALVQERGVRFAILIVKRHVLHSREERDRSVAFGHKVFGAVPVVLMAQDGRGTPTYWGRHDIVSFLSRISIRAIPWKRYTVGDF